MSESGEQGFRRTIVACRNAGVRACAGLMLAGLLIGLLFFARPQASILEKRELTPFPTFSASSFVDGSFFTELSLWYADTYPLREPMVGMAQGVKSLYGVQPQVKLVGGNVTADEIGRDGVDDAGTAGEGAAEGGSAGENAKPGGGDGGLAGEGGEVEAPDTLPMQEAMQQQLMNGLYIKDGAAYNIYYFVDDATKLYTDALSALADELEGQASVYSLLVPNGSAILLDEEELAQLGGSDQRQAIEYCYGLCSENVRPVHIFDALADHKDEYLYFRTDHHWTQLAAYYAYLQFCEVRGFEPSHMLEWENMEFDDFLGTFYSETYDESLRADTVHAYVPPETNDISFTDSDGAVYDSHVINDVTDWGAGTGYYCYGIGDYQLTHVENPLLADGSACLLLKDSFGNCLAPELIAHYQDLYVIDYRYSQTDIVQFVREHGISDVIVENNIAIASTSQIGQALYDQATGNLSDEEESEGEGQSLDADGAAEDSLDAEAGS